MVNIIKEEIKLEESLKKKLEFICDFAKVKPTIINGSIRKIDKTNLTYIEPHRVYIKNNLYLAFNYSSEIYVNNLKNVPLSKNNYILRQEDKDKLVEYLDKVDKTNNDYKTIQDLSVSLKDISIELSESKETIKILQESNNALELRNTKLKEENNKLKSRNSSLENELKNLKEIFEIFKNKLERLYHFFVDKMWGDKEKRDKYYPVAYELYGKNILDEEQIRGILGTKQRSAKIDNESKLRDDDMEL